MELSDKSLILNILHLPRLGLSPEQVQKIEHVIDGTVPSSAPLTMSYDAAAERIGLTAKNRAKTIVLWVRQGKLKAVVPPGCKHALGVTVESVEKFAKNLKAVKARKERKSRMRPEDYINEVSALLDELRSEYAETNAVGVSIEGGAK